MNRSRSSHRRARSLSPKRRRSRTSITELASDCGSLLCPSLASPVLQKPSTSTACPRSSTSCQRSFSTFCLTDPRELNMQMLKAAEIGDEELVMKLLDEGADVDFKSYSGWTALHIAAMNGHARVVQLLLARGANIYIRGPHKFTALHLATFKDLTGCCVRLLIDAGAELDSRNQSGRTALHFAAEVSNGAAVRELVAVGANPSLMTSDKRKPKDLTSSKHIRDLLP